MKSSTTYDTILVDRIRRGDKEAVETLFDQYRGRLYLYALKLTRHSEDANDLLAETLQRAYAAIERFHRGCSLSTWLHKIVKNCFLDSLKRHKHWATVSIDQVVEKDGYAVYPQLISNMADTEGIVASSMTTEHILGSVKRITPKDAAILRMFCVDQLTYEEISSELSVPVGTVKSRLNRARGHLRKTLDPALMQ